MQSGFIWSYRKLFLQLTFALLANPTLSAFASDVLPYSTRTHSYSGWGTPARGDIRTIGMAGATLGLADTYIAALDNPAGLAMTLNGADFNFTTGTSYNGAVQNYDNSIQNYLFGAALNDYPWGFSIGYVVPTVEGQIYQLSNPSADQVNLSIRPHEYHFSVARTLFDNQVSVGAGLILGQAETSISFLNAPQLNKAYYSYAVGASLGVSIQLPKRFILGLSYTTPMHYSNDVSSDYAPQLPGFFQPIEMPSRLGMGLGWIPNRFFRMDFSTFLIGTNQNTALLRSNDQLVGQNVTLQPKIGLAYYFIDEKELKSTLFLGTYYEVSRIQNEPDRVHATAGIELKPWILSLGWGLDTSVNYKNYIFSVGVDVFKVMEKLDIIPPIPHSPYRGFLPNPIHPSEEGLPRTLSKTWVPQNNSLDPIEVGLDIPDKIGEKAEKIKNSVYEIFQSSPSPHSKKKKHHRKKKAK